MDVTVYVDVLVGKKLIAVPCSLERDDNGRERWRCDLDVLTSAVENEADREEKEGRYDSAG